jgi:hypothetical protein
VVFYWTLDGQVEGGHGVSFKHVVHLASEEDKARLQSQPFFEKFAGDIDARCDEEPTVTPLTLVAGTRA